MKKTTTYLALGDSYTIGEGVRSNDSFPFQLSGKLGFSNPKIIAKTGWTTRDLLSAIEQETLLEKYDFVSLLIGVNNQYQGKSRNQYIEELHQLIQFAISKVLNKEKLIVISIPNYGYTPFGKNWQMFISSELLWYNQTIEKLAKENGLAFINITPSSLLAEQDVTLLAGDALHPSAKMYHLWVNEIVNALDK
jgi:acyl-CoA thioesterase I